MRGINFVLCPSHPQSTCITHLQCCKLLTVTVPERCSLALHQKVSFIARDMCFLMTLFISVKIQVYVPLLLIEIIYAVSYVSNSDHLLFWSTLDERFKQLSQWLTVSFATGLRFTAGAGILSLYHVLTGSGANSALQGYIFLGCDAMQFGRQLAMFCGSLFYQSTRRHFWEG